MEKIGYQVIVSGLVQGVGFRFFTAKEAHKLNIYGHAKNLMDGSVEVLMFGEKEQLQILLKFLNKGPQFSNVDSIIEKEITYIDTDVFLCL